jgi:hypothetical protein
LAVDELASFFSLSSAALHLNLHLGSAEAALQENVAKAKVLATHLRQLSGIQQRANAAAHAIAHTWHAGVDELVSLSLAELESFFSFLSSAALHLILHLGHS